MKPLNGYQLTRRLKKIRSEIYLSVTDQALYHELVSICNEKKWPDVFSVKNEALCLNLNVTDKTLIKSRKVLIENGLLFSATCKDKRYGCKYSFVREVSSGNSPDETTEEDTSSTVTSSGNSPDETEIPPYYNIKTQNPKSIYMHVDDVHSSSSLAFSFNSPEFMSTWNILRNTPKWKKKTDYALQLSLDKLARYPEEFAIHQMNRAIESNWSGVVYPGTDSEYEKWYQSKYDKNDRNRRLSKADKERLLLEEYAAILSGTTRYLPDEEVIKF